MKSILSYTAGFFLMAFALMGCSKNENLMYEEDPRIYFYRGEIIEYSFGVKPPTLMVDTIYIPVRIMGTAVNRDRVFNLKLEDSSTAKLGYHFSYGPLVVPANIYQISLPVYLYRKPGLKDSIVTAHISIAESADFKIGYLDKSVGTTALDRLHYRIVLNDQLLKPSNWDSYWVNHFGVYSKVKFQFMIQATGKINWSGSPLPQDLNFLIQTAKYALYVHEQANGPLIDELGNRVTFP